VDSHRPNTVRLTKLSVKASWVGWGSEEVEFNNLSFPDQEQLIRTVLAMRVLMINRVVASESLSQKFS
jgi:hypothetical protein